MAEHDATEERFLVRDGPIVFVGHAHPGATAVAQEGDRVALFRDGGVLIVLVSKLQAANQYRGRVLEAQGIGDERLYAGAQIAFADCHIHISWRSRSRRPI
jgi:hypothetical protein